MSQEKQSIDSETLRRWLAEGRKVTVLDIRKPSDRAEWFIPGSIHVDAYDALKVNDPNALANVEFREGYRSSPSAVWAEPRALRRSS